MARVLAIDHGTVRIGLALSDEMQLVASPLKTVPNGPRVVEELARIIQEKRVEKVIVGAPILMSGKAGSAMERVEKFVRLLEKAMDHAVPVELVDERLSSVTAEKALKRQGHIIDPKEGLVDQLAATVILQEYLNTIRGPEAFLLPDAAEDTPWTDPDAAPQERRRPRRHY
jgi:putative Holliday junction resolvase